MKAPRGGFSALLPSAGMEICRLFAIVSIFYLIPGSPPCPFAALAGVLAAGTLAGRGLSFVARRRITTLFVYGALCGLCVFFLARPYDGPAFWLSACAAGAFFFRGAVIGAGGVSHNLTVTRYDIGIGVFSCMYFFRMGMGEADPLSLRVTGAYFLFSILALAASRAWEQDENFTASRPVISLLVPFAAVFFLAASAVVLLYPLLSRAAGDAYGFLRDNSGPLQNFLISLIRFFFGFGRKIRSDASVSVEAGGGEAVPVEEFSEPGILDKIFIGVFVVFGAAIFVILLVILVRAFSRFLAAKKGPAGGEGIFTALGRLFRFLRGRLTAALRVTGRAVSAIFARRRPPLGAAEEAFSRLCVWGRVSGIPRRACETPAEYAGRLGARFPAAEAAAAFFARLLEEELYGGRPPADEDFTRLKAARNRLSSLALVPARLANRLGFRR